MLATIFEGLLQDFIKPLASGLFTLFVVIVTWTLTSINERRRFRREFQKNEFGRMEDFYASLIAAVDDSVKLTQMKEGLLEIERRLSDTLARARLKAPLSVYKQCVVTLKKLREWSFEYYKVFPDDVRTRRYQDLSEKDKNHWNKSAQLFKELAAEQEKLIQVVRKEYLELSKTLQK